jgi:signal transduction histidine kinase
MTNITVDDADPQPVTPLTDSIVVVIGLAALAAAVGVIALAFGNESIKEPGLQAGLFEWITLPYIGAGVLAWRRRPQSRLGRLMIAAGFASFLSTLAWSHNDFLATVGLLCDFLPPALLLHVCLAFPTGRLQVRYERTLLAASYVATVGFSFVRMLLGAFEPQNRLSLVDTPVAPVGLEQAHLWIVSLLCGAAIVALAAKRERNTRPIRRSRVLLVDSFFLAFVTLGLLYIAAVTSSPAFETVRRITFLVIGLAPAVFLVGLLQARLARVGVSDLLIELRNEPAPVNLRDALARTLRDPSLQLAFWLPQFGAWADLDGQPVDMPGDGSGRATTMIERNGARVAALVHNPSLREEPELVEAVGAAAGIALENARLQSELRARVEELAGSRARVIDAEQRERQRLERNLHDGAQQRLVALSLELGLLEERFAGDPDANERVKRARHSVAQSLGELRDIARGIHPAVVSAHGLAVALDELAAVAPFHVDVRMDGGRLPETVEVAAYYVVCESLANVAKHAHATSATVEVARSPRRVMVIVTDNGVGGADAERGSGLRGLADRVEGLGGRLTIWSPPDGGTKVHVELPCAS